MTDPGHMRLRSRLCTTANQLFTRSPKRSVFSNKIHYNHHRGGNSVNARHVVNRNNNNNVNNLKNQRVNNQFAPPPTRFINRNNIARTKWKRQNQLPLEQLRHQASVEKEHLSVRHAAAAVAYRAASTPKGLPGAGAQCCGGVIPLPSQTSQSLNNQHQRYLSHRSHSPCSFLSTAAAIFHNVTYVHGCQL